MGLTAPASDFTVSGSPVTGSGTVNLAWKVAPTSANTANAIVKRDGSGGFSAGAISAGPIAAAQLMASGTISASAMGLSTSTPTERLDLGSGGNVVISTVPPDDNTPGTVSYNLIGRGASGVPNKWSIYTAAVGGGFGVPANSFSIYQYPPNQSPACCLQRFTILATPSGGSPPGPVIIDQDGFLGIGGAPNVPLTVLVPDVNFQAADFAGYVHTEGDFYTDGCLYASGSVVAGTCVSDARLKKDIEPFKPVLSKLVQLQPVSYKFRAEEFPQFHLPASRTSGLIAQEVEKTFPEMVATGKDGFKRVNYSQLPYLMLEAIRELKADNDRLLAQVTAQEAQVREMVARAEDRDDERAELAQLRAEVARLAALLRTVSGTTGQASVSIAQK